MSVWRRWRSSEHAGTALVVALSAILAVLGGLLLIPFDAIPSRAEPAKQVRRIRVVGPRDNTPYGVIANVLEQTLRQFQNQLPLPVGTPIPTEGSVQTVVELDRLTGDDDSDFGIGLAQADVLYHYVFGGHPQLSLPRSSSNVRSLARIFDEWLLIGQPAHFSGAADQSVSPLVATDQVCGQRVGSGTLVTAINLARVLQAPWLNHLHACKPACSSNSGFAASGQPPPDQDSANLCLKVLAPSVSTQAGAQLGSGWTILGVPAPVAATMANVFGSSYSMVKPETFQQRFASSTGPANRTTVAVDAVLVVSRDMPQGVVSAVQCLIDDWDARACNQRIRSRTGCSALRLPDTPEETLKRIRNSGFCRVAEAGAKEHERGNANAQADTRHRVRFLGLPISRHGATIVRDLPDPFSRFLVELQLRQLQGAALLLLCALLATYARVERRIRVGRLIESARDALGRWGWRLSGFVAAHGMIAVLIWLAEYHSQALLANDRFVAGGVPESLRWVARYVVMDDREINFQSMWALMLVASLKAGWAVVALALTYDFGNRVWQYMRMKRMKQHVIVIGWNSNAAELVEEILTGSDCIIIPLSGSSSPPHYNQPRVSVLRAVGELGIDSLELAQLTSAEAVVIVADHEHAMHLKIDVDSLTLRLIEQFRRYETRLTTRLKRVVAEIIDPANVPIAHQLGRRKAASFDTLCTQQYGARFMGQMALKPAMGHFVRELATTKPESNELYLCRVSELRQHLPLKAFGDVRRFLSAYSGPLAVIPLGVQKADDADSNGSVRINPSSDEALTDLDQIIFLARESSDIVKVAAASHGVPPPELAV